MIKEMTSPPLLELPKKVIRHYGQITRRQRNLLNQHASGVLWLTGLSAAGKSTIAYEIEQKLFNRGIRSYVLDGDNVRHGLNSDLGFSPQDRKENIRRIVEVTKLFVDAGFIVLTSFISPYKEDRDFARSCFSVDTFYEVYIKCSIQECERRDPKGMYALARKGIIKNYTGISAPYEEPKSPDLVIDTEKLNIEDSIQLVLFFMDQVKMVRLIDSV